MKVNVGHGQSVPKSVVYFLPDSVPSGSLDFSFFASKRTNSVNKSVAYTSSASSSNLNTLANLKSFLSGFQTKNSSELFTKGINVSYEERGIKISNVDLPCLVFTSTDNSDIFKISLQGASLEDNSLILGFNVFVEEFKFV
jgi:hypothetical protein